MQITAIAATVLCMLALYLLLRDKEVQTSWALWIPIAWMCIAGSRSVSSWFGLSYGASLEQQFSEGTPLDAAIFLGMIVCGAIALNFRARRIQLFWRNNAALLVFFAYCGVSVAWSAQPEIALKHWVKLFGDLEMALIVLTDPQPRAALKQVFSRVGIVLLLGSILLIVAFPNLGEYVDPFDFRHYTSGVTTQKNELGMICIVLGLGAEWGFLETMCLSDRGRKKKQMLAQGVLVACATGLMLAANSITSISCLLLAGSLMALTSRPRIAQRPGLPGTIFWTAIALAVFAVFFDSSGTLLRMLGRNPSLTGRTKIWQAVLSFHTNPMIGTGFDSFWLGARIARVADIIGYKGIAEAHNGYLEIYINMGWCGLLLLLAMIASGYRRLITDLRGKPVYGSLRLALLGASLMYCLSEAGFRKLNLIWIALLMALIEIPPLAQSAPGTVQKWKIGADASGRTMKILR